MEGVIAYELLQIRKCHWSCIGWILPFLHRAMPACQHCIFILPHVSLYRSSLTSSCTLLHCWAVWSGQCDDYSTVAVPTEWWWGSSELHHHCQSRLHSSHYHWNQCLPVRYTLQCDQHYQHCGYQLQWEQQCCHGDHQNQLVALSIVKNLILQMSVPFSYPISNLDSCYSTALRGSILFVIHCQWQTWQVLSVRGSLDWPLTAGSSLGSEEYIYMTVQYHDSVATICSYCSSLWVYKEVELVGDPDENISTRGWLMIEGKTGPGESEYLASYNEMHPDSQNHCRNYT